MSGRFSCEITVNSSATFKSQAECMETYGNFTENNSCPTIFDNYLCWPSIPVNCTILQLCPKAEGTLPSAYAFRNCLEDGKWDYNNKKELIEKGFTYFKNCYLSGVVDILEFCEKIEENGGPTCSQIVSKTRIIELVGLSLSFISLLISLFIFRHYRVLKNNRTKIHMNLFVAIILQVVARIIVYSMKEKNSEIEVPRYHMCRVSRVLLEYSKTAMFMWMFIEGLYLHNLITVTVFQEYRYIKIYFYFGWIFPAFLTLVWLSVMIYYSMEGCWIFYSVTSYYWILEGPRLILIVINMLFLLNIIRVLVVKLRETQTCEIVQVRKAVRAAIFLLPLMGIGNLLYHVDYRCFKKGWQFALWSYSTYFLNTFQGFFIAVLYCFLNGEVRAAVKSNFYFRLSIWNYNYIPCKNATVVSTVYDSNPTYSGSETNPSHNDGGEIIANVSHKMEVDAAASQRGSRVWTACCAAAQPEPAEVEIIETKV